MFNVSFTCHAIRGTFFCFKGEVCNFLMSILSPLTSLYAFKTSLGRDYLLIWPMTDGSVWEFSLKWHTSLLTLCLCFPPSSQQRDTYMITLTGAGGTGQRGGGRGGWRERGRGGLRPAGGLPRDVTHLTTITSGFSLAKSTTKTNGGQCKGCKQSTSKPERQAIYHIHVNLSFWVAPPTQKSHWSKSCSISNIKYLLITKHEGLGIILSSCYFGNTVIFSGLIL